MEVDVKYGYIAGDDRFFFVMPILDVYDRSVVEFHIGLTCQAEEAANALREAVRRRKPEWQDTKPVIRTDNGPQFISQLFEETCEQLGLEHERIPTATPNKNAHIEAFNGIMEEECLARNEFHTFAEAYLTVIDFIDFYNRRRLHSALGYRSPQEFREAYRHNHTRLAPVKV